MAAHNIVITNSKGHLTEDEIENLVLMAEKRTEEDKQNLAKIRVKNLLETYCYETKSRLKSSNIDSKQKAIIEKEIDKALNWVKNDKQCYNTWRDPRASAFVFNYFNSIIVKKRYT